MDERDDGATHGTAPAPDPFGAAAAIDLRGRTVVVTGAGRGLGRAHALGLARRGAAVAVNDVDGDAARAVADEIAAAGGRAVAHAGSAADADAMHALVARATGAFGGVDVAVANAGILRDRSFAKMTADEFRAVVDVHLMGAFHLCKAVWPGMVARRHGRIVLTTSSSGLWGNFGQANYGAAKMALVGLMQTLAIEGARHGIRVNCLAPTAATAMTEGLLPDDVLRQLAPEAVVPALLWLASDGAPDRAIVCAGGGSFFAAHVAMSDGVHLGDGDDAPERLAAAWPRAAALPGGTRVPASGREQSQREIELALGRRRKAPPRPTGIS